MADTSLILQADQIVDIVRGFIRLKPRLSVVLPEDLAKLKQRLRELQPEGGPKRTADHDLFYHICTVLSQQREPLTMGELSESLAVPTTTATRMVDWLVEGGYVERLPDLADRRVVRVALTRTGRELYQTINRFVRQRVEQLLQHFTSEEREQLILLLRKTISALEKMEA